jgi:hypothetical protein
MRGAHAELRCAPVFPHAFGLKKPAPLWTAPALDRCLLLALIYPIATIFIIWAISGHVGPAEAALGLEPDISGWARGLAAAANGFLSFAIWRGVRRRGWKSRIWIAGAVPVALAAVAFAGGSDLIVLFLVAFVGAIIGAIAGAFAGG